MMERAPGALESRAERELTLTTVDRINQELDANRRLLGEKIRARKALAREIRVLEREITAARQVRSYLLEDHLPEEPTP